MERMEPVPDDADVADHGAVLLARYDEILPQVYGYLVRRVGNRTDAEDLTAEALMAAVGSIRRGQVEEVTPAWLIGIARHKLADHWRRAEREQRRLAAVGAPEAAATPDPWDAELDGHDARRALEMLGPHHRAALTLRYVDDLGVPDVAELIGRTVHATEALLVRARAAFRAAYEEVRS
jgi:RNA polymerase sigma-70 factor (ECF subfamily)